MSGLHQTTRQNGYREEPIIDKANWQAYYVFVCDELGEPNAAESLCDEDNP